MAILIKKNPYEEAMRYIDNAKEILSTKAGKSGDYYNDPKYVKMACNTAWNGVLVILTAKMKAEGKIQPKERMNVDKFENYLAKNNKKLLKVFNSAYNYLHLLGGYDGDLKVTTSKTGIELALKIIDWAK